jgi:eukaryotic-like serine/threonine-protein kinase
MIVMELLEGRTLRDELTDGPLPAARVAGIMRALSDAVDAAHAQGLLHRDLKPENILLAGDGPDARVKIVDFGIARPLDAGSESLDRLTRDGALVGTPRYMAPEQLAGGPPAPSWDIWALAVIAFEMLTGAHPFGERRHGLNIPPPLERFFARALSAQAADRFSTARALSAAMEAAAGAAGV